MFEAPIRVNIGIAHHNTYGCAAFAQVEQVDEESGNAMAAVTTAVVEAILEPLRPAMVAMRAKVEVGLFSRTINTPMPERAICCASILCQTWDERWS